LRLDALTRRAEALGPAGWGDSEFTDEPDM